MSLVGHNEITISFIDQVIFFSKIYPDTPVGEEVNPPLIRSKQNFVLHNRWTWTGPKIVITEPKSHKATRMLNTGTDINAEALTRVGEGKNIITALKERQEGENDLGLRVPRHGEYIAPRNNREIHTFRSRKRTQWVRFNVLFTLN